jgi:hypothetical protein
MGTPEAIMLEQYRIFGEADAGVHGAGLILLPVYCDAQRRGATAWRGGLGLVWAI